MLRPGLVPFAIASFLAGLAASSAPAVADATAVNALVSARSAIPDAERWDWPVTGFRLIAPYVQPADPYSAGHRGLDLEPVDPGAVSAPAPGVVAFAGIVADRALVTIDHGDGLVTTLEPVTPRVEVGEAVARGEVVGDLGFGGHTPAGALHFGVRSEGEYINPLVLLGGVPRAVLLPCCD
jgi:murein DD-endopeptidase MepM/ murein hydrolase activator NlpD